MTSAGYADRLAFTLPDFTRIAWVSDHARTVWQPRIREISAMRSRVEQQSVADGVRRCFLGRMTTDELVTTGPVWARRGLALLALRREGIVEGYTASPVPAGTGQRDGFLVVGGRPADTAAFYDAWIAQDHDSMGELLGYPACCRAFFTDVWVAAQCVDTTWQMTASAREPGVRAVRFSGPVETNMLWRWMGLRMVSHLPCDIRCAATIGVAAQIEEVAVRLGASAGILREILDWPVEWTALHGIAEIKTPICKIVTRTDATAGRYSVAREGKGYPAEGANGLGFPYRRRATVLLPPPIRRADEHLFRDNGFRSHADMTRLHAPIVDAATSHLGDTDTDIADLGCGNGVLLREIVRCSRGRVGGLGIDLDPAKLERATTLCNGTDLVFVAGDLFDLSRWASGRSFHLVLLAARRLREVPRARALAFIDALAHHSRNMLLYAYPDAADRGLAEMLAEFGLDAVRIEGPTALVRLSHPNATALRPKKMAALETLPPRQRQDERPGNLVSGGAVPK